MTKVLESIIEIVSGAGLSFRGAFHPSDDDGVPGGGATVVMLGNIGSSMWPYFEAGRRDEPNALDAWTRRVLEGLVTRLQGLSEGVTAIHPSDGPPYFPFQQWAKRADCVYPSPIGPLIHPEYGLWHAYRGALIFQEKLELPARAEAPSPCDTCQDKPCLTTCPVGAFTPGAYDTAACANHMTTPQGEDCLSSSCRARRACPVGQEHAYNEAQSRFHMSIFRDKYAT